MKNTAKIPKNISIGEPEPGKYESQHAKSLADIDSWILGMHDRYEYLYVFKLKDWVVKNILSRIDKNYEIRTKQNTRLAP